MAKLGTTNIGGGGGIGSDELTVTKNKVVEGYTYVGADTDDEIGNGTIPNKESSTASQSVTTSGSNLVTRIPNGAYITNASSGYPEITSSLSTVTSAGGLTAAKLLANQNAFGLSGTATSDATATADQILSGKTAYINGLRVTGTIIPRGSANITLNAGNSYSLLAGYYNDSTITAATLSSQTSATATAANLISGYTAWVNGSKIIGTATDYSYLAVGRVVF